MLNLLIIISLVCNIILSVAIFLRNPKGKENRFFTAFTTFLSLWMGSNFLENEPGMVGTQNLGTFLRLDFAFAILVAYAWFRFCSEFSRSRFSEDRYTWLNKCALLLCLLFTLFSIFTPIVIKNFSFYESVIHFESGILWPFYSLLLIVLVAGGVVILLIGKRQARKSNNAARARQINIILTGFSISIGCAILVNLFLQTFFTISLEVSRFGLYGMLFLTSFTAYAIARRRFMDMRLVIARSVAYLLLVISLGIIYCLGLLLFTSFIIKEPTTVSSLSASTLLAVIIAFSFQSLLTFFERITDKIFYREKYDESNLLHELALIMASRIRLGDLTVDLLKKLLKEVRISRGAFVLIDDKKVFHLAPEGYAVEPQFSQEDIERLIEPSEIIVFDELSESSPLKEFMRKLNVSVIVPLHTKTEHDDILILGEKLSGDPYTDQDIRLLEVFAPEVAVAIANSSSVERLLRLDEVKSEFITVVSHQLRTPLSVARWNFELLLEGTFGKLPRKAGFILRDTYQAFMALNQGMNNLVSALEVEEGKVMIKYERVEINRDVIEEAIADLEKEAKLKSITIRRRLSFKRTVVVDRQKMKKVVGALLDNAIRYSPKSSTVTIATRWQKINRRNELLISVEDDGIGIPDENHEIIFQKFFRGDEAKRMFPAGFGLSLFTARGYVKLHKGRLWVEKKNGPGSLFCVLIPVSSTGK